LAEIKITSAQLTELIIEEVFWGIGEGTNNGLAKTIIWSGAVLISTCKEAGGELD